MKKPRKSRYQTMAEKGFEAVKLYPWTSLLGRAYTYAPTPSVWATLTEQDGKWLMTVKLNGQKFHGERTTLEAAFKATCNLLFKHAKEYWLRMDARPVTKNFADFLKGEV
jgi:hypothetical protein